METLPAVRRGVELLGASFGVAWIAIAMTAAPGPAAWVALSGNAADAGFFFTFFSLAAASGAALGGRAMDRWGRRPVLVAGHLVAAAGFAAAGLAFLAGSLRAFALSTILLASAIGVVNLTRLAASDLFPPARRARGVAAVQLRATLGAAAGPFLLVAADFVGRLTGRPIEAVSWFIAAPLLLASALLVARAPEPLDIARDLARDHSAETTAPAADPAAVAAAPRLPLAFGFASLAFAQGSMVAVMGVTGVAMKAAGHAGIPVALVMSGHFIGMFALSTIVGRLADRYGRRLTILGGLAFLGAGAAVTALVADPSGLAVGLFLVGFGWSLAYIAGTVVIADVVPVMKRARVLGLADFCTAVIAASSAFAGGLWYARSGLTGLGLGAAVPLVVPLALAVFVRETTPGTYGSTVAKAPADVRVAP